MARILWFSYKNVTKFMLQMKRYAELIYKYYTIFTGKALPGL
jgi:hypothetical protein